MKPGRLRGLLHSNPPKMNRLKKILIMGLPGAGKSTLAKALAQRLNAVHLNADEIRKEINKTLGFSLEDRIEHARRMGVLADIVTRSGSYAIADFVCPTPDTFKAFTADQDAFVIFVDRIQSGRFEDTNKMFVRPESANVVVTADGTAANWAHRIAGMLQPAFNPKAPTALFVGRYQTFHAGHRALIEEGIKRVGQACIAVRDTQGTSDKDPLSYSEVEAGIRTGMRGLEGRYIVAPLPNITAILYGRDVGYTIDKIDLPETLTSISATAIRKEQNS